MKKTLLGAIMALLFIPITMEGQSYGNLWKQVENAEQHDLPQTQRKALEQIARKAEKEKAYGQLLKALLTDAKVAAIVSPDSLAPAVEQLKQREQQATSIPLQAVYQAVLSRIYDQNRSLDDHAQELSAAYAKQAVSHPKELAAVGAADYEPFVVKGEDSRLFGNDLLSLIGMETNQYEALHQYYLTTDNRPAQLLTALPTATGDLPRIDSLISLYGDLPECGEAAIEHYNCLRRQENITPRELVAYIDEATSRWGAWKRLNELRNQRNQLTALQFSTELSNRVVTPKCPQTMLVRTLRGIKGITLHVYRVRAEGDIQLNPRYEKDYRTLKTMLAPLPHLTQNRKYDEHPEHETFTDSIQLPGLLPGVYLIEMESQPKTEVARELYFVSNVRVLSLGLPDNQIRYVAVNATTGQPLAGAKLRLKTNARRNADGSVVNVTCDGKGEYLYRYEKGARPNEVFATAKDDRFCPPVNGYGYYSYYQRDRNLEYDGEAFTDRAIYRPGQTVHACAILYSVKNGFEHQAVEGKEVKATLRDANYQVVEEKTLRTDAFGTVACDFKIPTNGLTGEFRVSFDNCSRYFHVEEYKRPTFQVEIPKPEQDYKAGDTLTVKGTAKSYAGVPVQGARVAYRVERRQAWWWLSYMRYWDGGFFGSMQREEEIFAGEAMTDADGSFEVRMPMVLPEGLGKHTMFYNFVVTADVTDEAGETHHGELSLPLGNRKTALSVDLAKNVQKENPGNTTFHLRNAAGTDLSETVSYRIDEGKWQQVQTNAPFSILNSPLKSGRHQLEAVCKDDTLKQDFVVFSLDDRRPAAETDDWFYLSANQFPNDERPVTLQVGSSAKDVHIVYTIVAGNKIIESGAVKRSNELINRKLTYKEEYGNGLALCYAWVKNGKTYQHTKTILRPLPEKKLQLKWETFRDRLTPGQQEEWTLKITKTEEQGTEPSGNAEKSKASNLSPLSSDLSPLTSQFQLMATLYDKSLDQIRKNEWNFTPRTILPLPSMNWHYGQWGGLSLNGYKEKPYQEVKELVFSVFDQDVFPTPWSRRRATRGVLYSKSAAPMNAEVAEARVYDLAEVAVGSQKAIGAFDVAGNDEAAVETEAAEAGQAGDSQLLAEGRKNLQETAFFYPQLVADSTGIVAMKFTLPESLTTWRFMGLAHTPDMMYGMIEGEAVAKKNVMIQPNVPRFVRMGDKATVSARIFNTTDKGLNGVARLTLSDPESNKIVHQEEVICLLEANSTAAVSFNLPQEKLQDQSLLVCLLSVSGETFSDGEQQYLPVLPNRERVTVTVPFTQTQPGTKTIDLQKIYPQDAHHSPLTSKLTIEYTNNPAWLMIQALPSVGHANDNCAICQAAAYYANSLGQHILKQNPQAKHVFEMWKRETGQETSLQSALEKNEELKDLMLNETPWVMDADREAEQKQRLSDFFDEGLMKNRLSTSIAQLKMLQNADGSWSWWPGMDGSFYMTVEVSEMLVRLNRMTGTQEASKPLLDNAFNFMDNEIIEMVAEMKKQEKKGIKQTFPSHKALQYLYLSTLDGRKPSTKVIEAQAYLKHLLRKDMKNQTLYEKALSAIILHSPLYIKSLKEYSVYQEDMGRYYDSPRASYSWRDYRIPTQVAAIEAIQQLTPNDKKTIDEMRRWLLQEKRAQAWDTPINSSEAIYAFLNKNSQVLLPQAKTELTIDGKPLETSKATAGIGYVKTTMPIEGQQTFTAKKTSTGTSWGAVYAQFMQDTKDIQDQSSELSVKREILMPGNASGNAAANATHDAANATHDAANAKLSVGQRIKVRITITAQRDLDFVEVIDRRAACMEPLNQLSGYHYGYYCAPKDNATHYYFDCLRKGKHVIETEYYIDRTGQYETGTCTAQCAYAPEFRGTTHSQTLIIEE